MTLLSEQEVFKRFHDMEKHYAGTHASMRATERLHEQQYAGLVDVPYEVRIFQSSTPTRIIDGFRNQIRTNEPTVNVRPFGASKQDEKDALLLQRWGYGALQQESANSTVSPNAQCAMDLLLRGASCKKIIVDVERMVGPAPRRGSKAYKLWELEAIRTWPYISVALDPLTVYPAPGQRKPLPFMIEKQIRYAGDLWDQYPDWSDPKRASRKADGDNPSRHVEWIEYWDNELYYLMADGVFIQPPKKNPYGFVPYIFEWSGMGRSHADGDPRHLAIGILTNIAGELIQEVQLKTAISVQSQMHVFPPILTVEDPRKVARQFGVGPGKVIKHMPGNPPVYMNFPPPNDNHYLFLEKIESSIARVLSPALSGGSDSSVRYGVLNAQRIGQALTTIAPVRATLDRIGSQTLNMMSQMAHAMDIDMAISGTQEPVGDPYLVKGTDHKHQNFVVLFESVDPSENDRALLVGEALRRAGDISRRTFWEKYAKDTVRDPDEEEARLDEEILMAQLFESGAMLQAALSEDVQNEFDDGNIQDIRTAVGESTRGQSDQPDQAAQSRAQELEAISGTPGAATIPRQLAEEGNRQGRTSITGRPER